MTASSPARSRDGALPRLAVTLGDPRGIGPEIVEKALADERVRGAANYTVVGPAGVSVPVDEAIGDWVSGGDAALAGALAAFAHGRAAAAVSASQVRGYTLDDVMHALPSVWALDADAPRPPVLAELPAVGEPPR